HLVTHSVASRLPRVTRAPLASSRRRGLGGPPAGASTKKRAAALLRDPEHDLPELLARLEPLVRRPRLREREHRAHHRPPPAAAHELVGALEVRLRPHRRAVDGELLPP